MKPKNRYRALEAVVESLGQVDVTADDLPILVGKLKRAAKKALAFKEPARNPRFAEVRKIGAQKNADRAETFRQTLAPVLAELKADGIVNPEAVAKALNARGVRSARGGEWTRGTISRFLG